jgi:hypothetical protein
MTAEEKHASGKERAERETEVFFVYFQNGKTLLVEILSLLSLLVKSKKKENRRRLDDLQSKVWAD